MKKITISLTVDEIALLTSLAADQLFRKQFIDPRMPGYRAVPGEVERGKSLVARLRLLIGQGPRETTAAPAARAQAAEVNL